MFQQIYLPGKGHAVFKYNSDKSECDPCDYLIAIFMGEREAIDYCNYRNNHVK